MEDNVRNVAYYVDEKRGELLEKAKPEKVFLTYDNVLGAKVGYAPAYGHFSFDEDGLKRLGGLQEINVEQYKMFTLGYNTPKEYLVNEKYSTVEKDVFEEEFREMLLEKIYEDEMEYCFDRNYMSNESWKQLNPNETRSEAFHKVVSEFNKLDLRALLAEYDDQYDYLLDDIPLTVRFVNQLDESVQGKVESEIRRSISLDYTLEPDEFEEVVQNGMDSKVDDLSDTIDLRLVKIWNAEVEFEKEKEVKVKNGGEMER